MLLIKPCSSGFLVGFRKAGGLGSGEWASFESFDKRFVIGFLVADLRDGEGGDFFSSGMFNLRDDSVSVVATFIKGSAVRVDDFSFIGQPA